MNEKLSEQIRKNLEAKNSDKLKLIYQQHDEDEWSEEAIKFIHQILVSRGEIIPHIEPRHKRDQYKMNELYYKAYQYYKAGDQESALETSRHLLIKYPNSKEAKQAIKKFAQNNFGIPKVWVGYVLSALLFFFASGAMPVIHEIVISERFPSFEKAPIALPILFLFLVFAITVPIYWFFCVYKIHKVLIKMTDGSYTITPWKAVLLHLIPLYNWYWLIKWPKEIVSFVNNEWVNSLPMIGPNTIAPKERNKYRSGITFLAISLLIFPFKLPGMGLPEHFLFSVILSVFMFGGLRYLISAIQEAFVLTAGFRG